MMGQPEIVMTQVSDELSPGLPQSFVVRLRLMTCIGWQIDPFYPWVAYAPNNRLGVIRAAVANDQHLEIGERLS
jgi:hypothetical protein